MLSLAWYKTLSATAETVEKDETSETAETAETTETAETAETTETETNSLMPYYEHLRATYAILIIQHTSWNSLSTYRRTDGPTKDQPTNGPTDGRTDMGNYRAAIAAKNIETPLRNYNY